MSELSIETRELEGVRLLYPNGFINAHTVRLFETEIQKAMMGAIEEIRDNGGDLRLTELNETVLNIFEILGFNHLYKIFHSELEAITSFREGGGSPS